DPDALVQLAPLDGGASMTLTQSGATTATGADSNAGHLALFSGGPLAPGTTAHSGNVVIAADGSLIDIGDSNLFVLTTGSVTGLDSVRSTGIVKDLATLINGEFEIPQTDEIDTSQDIVQTLRDDYALDDRDDDDEGD